MRRLIRSGYVVPIASMTAACPPFKALLKTSLVMISERGMLCSVAKASSADTTPAWPF
jgi:hypothetical protein